MQAGVNAMPEYEVLEMALFRAFPRGDTKPLAKTLIKEFGSFTEVISAPPERLRQVKGVGPRVVRELKFLQGCSLLHARGQVKQRQVLSSWSAVLEYCRVNIGLSTNEQLHILFLDKKNQLIADEIQQKGTVDHTPAYPREIVKRALDLGASAIILVHNHPSGDPTPSTADIDMTHRIIKAGETMNVTVHDHIIVGRNGHASFKGLKLI